MHCRTLPVESNFRDFGMATMIARDGWQLLERVSTISIWSRWKARLRGAVHGPAGQEYVPRVR